MLNEEEKVFNTKEEQLENIVNELNKIKKISDAKDNALIVSSDDEGKPLTFLKKLKMSGALEKVEVKDGKLDIKLNENFCGTIDFCGDLTSYKRYRREGDGYDRTGPFIIERPFGNEIIIDVFEELLNKIQQHNEKHKQKDKQIQFVAVPGNHEFLGFQGNEDNRAVVGEYEKFQIDPIDGRQALKTKLRGVKVIADIQKYYLKQVKENGEEKDIVDDDYGDSIGNIAEKIDKLEKEISNINSLIKNIDEEKMEDINKDIEILKKNRKATGLTNINDLTLSKLNVLQWNKTPLLSKIVFCHNGKKFRTLHSFALFASPKALAEYGTDYYYNPEKITEDNQQDHFRTNLNKNIVNINGVNNKSFPDKTVFDCNIIATFVGHEGERLIMFQTDKVFCVDTTGDRYMLFIVDVDNNCIQGYDIETRENKEFHKIKTYDVREKKYVKIQSNIRGYLARKKYQAKKKNTVKIQSNIRRHLAKQKLNTYKDDIRRYLEETYGGSYISDFIENFFSKYKDEEFQKDFCNCFGGNRNDWFGFLSKDNNKQKLVVDKQPKKIKNNSKLINKKKKKTSLKKQ